MEFIVETRGINKTFDGVVALRDVSLHVPPGAIYIIMGAENSGKSTLIRLLAGWIKADSGTISLRGASDEKSLRLARRNMGFMIGTDFYPYLSAYDNLLYLCKVRGIQSASAESRRVLGYIDIGMSSIPVSRLSQGRLQRLAFAAALMGHPTIVILDEPCRGLDPANLQLFRSLVKEIHSSEGSTFVFTAQIQSPEDLVSTHCAILQKGEILQELTSARLSELCRSELIIKVDETAKALITLEQDLGTTHFSLDGDQKKHLRDYLEKPETVADALFNRGIQVQLFYPSSITIEEYARQLASGERNG